MSWEYRVVREKIGGKPWFSIREVYDGKSWTVRGMGPEGDTLEEFLTDLIHIIDAVVNKPVLSVKKDKLTGESLVKWKESKR